MSIMIGEALIRKGVITRGQLEDALRAQLVFGGHLGTCMIEMNMLDEETLGRTLSQIWKVPYAPAGLLMNAPGKLIKVFSRESAEKYLVIPVELHERTLQVAMINPGDVRAIEDLGFLTSWRIEPMVAPEIRILQALEKHYDIPRRGRYIKVLLDMERAASRAGARDSTPARASGSEPASEGASRQSGPARETQGQPQERNVDPQTTDDATFDEMFGYNRNWRDVAAHLMGETRGDRREDPYSIETFLPRAFEGPGASDSTPAARESTDAPHPPGGGPARPEPAARNFAPGNDWSAHSSFDPRSDEEASSIKEDLGGLADLLCRARNHDQAADAILQFVTGRARRAILLSVEGDRVSFWGSAGLDNTVDGEHEDGAASAADWMFQLLLGRDHYRGPLPDAPSAGKFCSSLEMEPPTEILMVPIHVDDRLIGVFYADGGRAGQVRGETSLYFQMIRMFCLALSHIAIKQRIRAMAAVPQVHAEPVTSGGGTPETPHL